MFAVLEALDLGAERVAYVDFDSHHGDGVEDALADPPNHRPVRSEFKTIIDAVIVP